jgi:hypothetical protein
MRRTTIIFSAALMLLVLGPASALARHHSRHHRSRSHHARLLRLGDTNSGSTSSSSAHNAGTVASFTGGILTINTSDGPIRGRVTDQTECMAPSQSQTMHQDGDNGGGGDQSGDGDHGGSGDDQGQDQNDANEANEDQNEANENQNEANENQAEDQNEANEANENQAEEQNEANEDQNDEEAAMSCAPGNLPGGAVVREAELRISGTGNVWKKVELGS